MTDDLSDETGPTRRAYVRLGAAVATGGLLAGCAGTADDGDAVPSETDRPATATDARTETPTDTSTGDGPYSVSMSPVDEVTFEEPPQTVFTRLTHHADMAFALGRGDGVTAMHAPDYYDALWNQFVERLPGVTLDWSGLYSSWEPDKEVLYELDSDIHLADPAWVTQLESWDRSDIEEISETISPWFGNSLSDRHQEPAPEWADGYEYYGLWEQFEIVAEAFRERERYEELAAVHNEMLATIEAGLPPKSERPVTAMFSSADLETIYAYTLDTPGFLTAHTSPLGARDAFAGTTESGDTVDYETLLEADPEVILYLGGMLPTTDMAEVRATLESHSVGGEITAVANGRVHAQGARYQGPILNLFQTEMTAKQLYPEQFGEWPEYETGPYPEIPEDEQLFDRERVANAINGTVA